MRLSCFCVLHTCSLATDHRMAYETISVPYRCAFQLQVRSLFNPLGACTSGGFGLVSVTYHQTSVMNWRRTQREVLRGYRLYLKRVFAAEQHGCCSRDTVIPLSSVDLLFDSLSIGDIQEVYIPVYSKLLRTSFTIRSWVNWTNLFKIYRHSFAT